MDIKAGWGIEAGWGIKAGWGIEAGEGIKCQKTLSFKLRLFAGLCIWRLPTSKEMEVRCAKKEGGEVIHGNLIETGIKSLSGKKVTVTVGEETYTATID